MICSDAPRNPKTLAETRAVAGAQPRRLGHADRQRLGRTLRTTSPGAPCRTRSMRPLVPARLRHARYGFAASRSTRPSLPAVAAGVQAGGLAHQRQSSASRQVP